MKRTTVLVIEDDWAVFESIKAFLSTHQKREGYDYQVIHAQDAIDGLEQTWLYCPDIILLDAQLPRLDGYEMSRSLRSVGDTTPVIVMTANGVQSERQKWVESGCNASVTKPLNLSSLHDSIQRLLAKRSSALSEREVCTPEKR